MAAKHAMTTKSLAIIGCAWLGAVVLWMLLYVPIFVSVHARWRALETIGNIVLYVLYGFFLYGWIVPLCVAANRRFGFVRLR
jgi:hypothetical protein